MPQLVRSSKGRFFDMGFLHTVLKCQFKGTRIVPGANVTMLEKSLNDEQRDRQVEMDEMMLQGTRDMIRALGQNPAFRQCAVNRSPIGMPGGSTISTAPPESYQFPTAGPPIGSPFDGSAGRDPNQPPAVLPWPNTGPPLPEGPPPSLSGERALSPPPPPPPLSSAPTEARQEPPPPPPTLEPSAREIERLEGSARKRSRSSNKMPKRKGPGGASSSGGRWRADG